MATNLGPCAARDCGAPVWDDMAHVRTPSGLVIHFDCVARLAVQTAESRSLFPVNAAENDGCADPDCINHHCPEHPRHHSEDHTYEQCHSPEDHYGPGPCLCTTYNPDGDQSFVGYNFHTGRFNEMGYIVRAAGRRIDMTAVMSLVGEYGRACGVQESISPTTKDPEKRKRRAQAGARTDAIYHIELPDALESMLEEALKENADAVSD